ncbi:MAG: hypothetical protein WA510_11210 [Acidobacteriaceae bacterium]
MCRQSVFAVCVIAVLLFCPLLLFPALGAEHEAPPAGVATDYPAFDLHSVDQVAIAADPYDTQEKASIFRIKYQQYGFMPIRIIVTNNGDKPISLIDARINFITAFGDKIPAAEPEDVERRLGDLKRPDGGYKLPGPLPRIGNKSGNKNKDVEEDFKSLEYSAVAVEPHTTRAGFLFYDVKGLDNPLEGAKLNLRMLRDSQGKEMFYFEIPFDKYLHRAPASK